MGRPFLDRDGKMVLQMFASDSTIEEYDDDSLLEWEKTNSEQGEYG